jgi:U6 snRNA-associated Sm-like protein LSm7
MKSKKRSLVCRLFACIKAVTDEDAEPEYHVRSLGLAVLRGPTITLLSPVDGLEEISNPFLAPE